jgi:hypothetical protein
MEARVFAIPVKSIRVGIVFQVVSLPAADPTENPSVYLRLAHAKGGVAK